MRVGFVYANPRARYQAEIAAGMAPDTSLLGQNHLAALGVDAAVHEPRLGRRGGRAAWNLREVVLPWELGGHDVVCAALGPLLPLAARARRRPRVVLLNMSLCNRLARAPAALRRVYAAGLRGGDIACFAEAQRERLIEQADLSPRRVHLVELGIDEGFMHTDRPAPADGYVLAVGRDLARDYATLAAAVQGLDVRVVIVASARNVEGLVLPGNVELRLDVDAVELRSLYEGARAVVVPGRDARYPLGADCSGQTVLLEGWAMARPVIVSDRPTLRGYAERDRNALVVPPEQPEALREGIGRVLADDALARRLAAAGRADVEARFTTRHLADRLAALVRLVHERP